jgi:tetratricopeptide (TPR) repeat protein
MTMKGESHRARVFVSHASANLKNAQEVSAALRTRGADPWLDQADIRVGGLLRKQLQEAIEASRAVVLLWSKPAAASRWVAAEVLTAFHLDRFVVPCLLSEVDLPQFLSKTVHFDLRRHRADVLARLGEQVQRAPQARNEYAAATAFQDPELRADIDRIMAAQETELSTNGDVGKALRLHAETEKHMRRAEKRWPYDPTILNLAGYHRKNAYMFGHWAEYCAGRFPEDPVLQEGERFFFDTLFVNPTDYSALNGLGNILLFEGELDAAEFFVQRAIEWAERSGVRYDAAIHDLGVIRGRMRAPTIPTE